MNTPSLFSMVARRRPEWLAQGVFAYALKTDPAVRALILRRAGSRLRHTDQPEVYFERPVGRWRADVEARWPCGKHLHFELKLGAGLTTRQAQLLRRRKAILVYPRGQCPQGMDDLAHVTWTELARRAQNPAVKALFAETDATSTWWRELLDLDHLAVEFSRFQRGESWERLYQFLLTIDTLLSAELGERYTSGNFALSRSTATPYYGFWFKRGLQRRTWFFLGAELVEGAPGIRLTLQYASRRDEKQLATWRTSPLSARRIARLAARACARARDV